MLEIIMVKGVCPDCSHLCEGPLTRRAAEEGKPIICCGGKGPDEKPCGGKITNYEAA